ncbi:MAG TPA: SGNH/GDSL hydrolase family protein [Candidatus Limnocylindrales bacterium]|nr:SGNH/GDSL hydrolase family protein [Candidatus Limnocylindrales bacterium]
MSKFLLTFVFAACLAITGNTAPAGTPSFSRESIEWCDIWISHADETNLPRVLLIGDSISRDYYPGVEKCLAGKAYVGRLSTSAFISDPALLQEIKMVLGEYRFEVIHFNNGMHGWQYSEKEYRQAFPEFLKTIRKSAPKAKLIWATTTPLKVSPKLPSDNQIQATDERIAERNAIALKFVQAEGIPVDDLNAPVRGHPEYHSDNVHFNSRGIDFEAAQVAMQIELLLKN